MTTIAVLYIDPRGPYPGMAIHATLSADLAKLLGRRGVALDCWDATRDARKYDGPHPVVAHPPCGPWGRLQHLYKGNEHDCAPRAVEQVRRWGGILEHPAGSLLWREEFPRLEPERFSNPTQKLPQPARGWGGNGHLISVDEWGGYTIEVDQCEWGHVARKRTWLYLVGVPREAITPPPFPGRKPTRYAMKVCSAQQRRRTPPLFAEWLVGLARSVRRG